MTSTSGARIRGLAPRLAATFALALLPVGLIALWQSTQISDEADRRRETLLLALTSQAVASEERLITAAQGAARALTATVLSQEPLTDPSCSEPFKSFVATSLPYSFAGFVDASGILACASTEVGRDLREMPTFQKMQSDPEARVIVNRAAAISKTSIIGVVWPVFDGGTYRGYVIISIPHDRIGRDLDTVAGEKPVDIVTFSSDGVILTSRSGLDGVEDRLPLDLPLDKLVNSGRTAFTSYSNKGEVRTFAVVPVIPGEVYALGSWAADALSMAQLPPWVFPTTMLLAGLITAWFAANGLVVRHIRALQNDMEEFARTRRLTDGTFTGVEPDEIRAMAETWQEIARKLLMDEAELERALVEKNVLLKEVHHRVKNNLQLIASIISMKLRRARSPDAQTALKEVQMRVMSIASVHRSLYLSSDQGRVNADALLKFVIDTTIEAGAVATDGIEITRNYERVIVYPDQAVPLSLFAAEAVTNALKYIGRRPDGVACLDVSLTARGSEHASFSVSNSQGTPLIPPDLVKGSGLGHNLLTAFAVQMRGEFEFDHTDTSYSVRVSFPVLPFSDEVADGAIHASD